MGVFKLRPARPEVKVIADIDEIISQPIGFRFNGRIYTIQPISTRVFVHVAQELQSFTQLLKKKETEEITEDEIYNSYYRWVKSVCPEISQADIRKMTVAQLNALMNLIIEHMTGRTAKEMLGDAEKKKMNSGNL